MTKGRNQCKKRHVVATARKKRAQVITASEDQREAPWIVINARRAIERRQ
ncbi:hypothetical protein ACI5CP_001647 [Cronobacter turicensis]|nr:hypothetical protein [Cronobacter turicensis]ELY4606059.1 hypothetical protein [Cronobacter turicensis]